MTNQRDDRRQGIPFIGHEGNHCQQSGFADGGGLLETKGARSGQEIKLLDRVATFPRQGMRPQYGSVGKFGLRQNNQDSSISSQKDMVPSSRVGSTYGSVNPNFNGQRNGLREST